MKKLFIALCILSSFASARTVTVLLDAPQEFVMHHFAAVNFGLRYTDGDIEGANLFTTSDLIAGVTSKPQFWIRNLLRSAQISRLGVLRVRLLDVPGGPGGTPPRPHLCVLDPENFVSTS
jgi:hypothetical protein